jgi:hypothetical protein
MSLVRRGCGIRRGYWRLTGGIRVPGRQPGQLRIDVAHHRPDGGDPRRQGRRIRALAVGVELVDGLSHAPESRPVYRTHRRRLSARWCLRACLRKPSYPQVSGMVLWKKDVDHQPGNPPKSFSSTHPVDRIFPVHSPIPVAKVAVSTNLSPSCAQRSRRVCTRCPHPCPPRDLVPRAPRRQNVRVIG